MIAGLATPQAWSESISYSFAQNPGNQVLDTVTPKGPLGTTFWNDSTAEGAPSSGSENNLVDGSGNATGASITWSSANTWLNGSGTASEDAKIVVGYLDDGGSGANVTISNIPYAKYNVYGIVGSDQGAEYSTGNFTVNGAWALGGTNTTTAPAYGSWGAASSIWTRTMPSTGQRGNYWRINGVTGSTCTIQGVPRAGDNRSSLAAIIIEELTAPDRLVHTGDESYDQVALGAGLTSEFRLGLDHVTVTAPDGLSATATHSITVTPRPGIPAGNYPLIDYQGAIGNGGFGALSLTPFPNARYGMNLVNNTADSAVDVAYTPPEPLVWTDSQNTAIWDNGATANWKTESGGTATTFQPADIVKFDDTSASGSVFISGVIEPLEVEVSNDTLDYTFSGNVIGGEVHLTKSGIGRLTLLNNNIFSGNVLVEDGLLAVGDGVTGSLSGNATVETQGFGELLLNPPAEDIFTASIVNDGLLTVEGSGPLTLSGRITGSSYLYLERAGTTTISSFNNTVNIVVADGATLAATGGSWGASFFAGGTRGITVETGGDLITGIHSLGGLGATLNQPTILLEQDAVWTLNGEQYLNGDNLQLEGGIVTISTNDLRLQGGTVTSYPAGVSALIQSGTVTLYGNIAFDVADGDAEFDFEIHSPIIENGAGRTLTKYGAGTLALAETSYTGITDIQEGTLQMTFPSFSDDAVVNVSGGAFLDLAYDGTDVILEFRIDGELQANGTWGALGSGAEHESARITGTGLLAVGLPPDVLIRVGESTFEKVALGANLTSEFRPGIDLATVATPGGFSVDAPHYIAIIPVPGVADGNYTLIDYQGAIGGGGFGALSLASFPNSRYTLSLVDNTANSSVDIAYTTPGAIVWTASQNGAWDAGLTSNWKTESGGTATTFLPYDIVKFDDTAGGDGTVTLSGLIEPLGVEVANDNLDYTISGDPIAGLSGIVKSGTGSLTLLNDNTFSGSVLVDDGLLAVGDGVTGSIAAGVSVEVQGFGELVVNPPSGGAFAASVVNNGVFTAEGSGTLTLGGQVTGSGELFIRRTGSTTMSGSGHTGSIFVTSGATLAATGGGWAASFFAGGTRGILVESGGTLTTGVHSLGGLGAAFNQPSILLEEGGSWNLQGEQYLNGDNLQLEGATISINVNDLRLQGGTVAAHPSATRTRIQNGAITLYGNAAFDVADGGAPDDFEIASRIAESGAGRTLTKYGTGLLAILGETAYTGATDIQEGTLRMAQATLAGGLADGAAVNVASGAFLDLAHGQSDTVLQFQIDGVSQTPGTWGALGSGAQYESPRILGAGLLVVTGAADPFADWISANYPELIGTGMEGRNVDADSDGLINLAEFALDGNPVSGAASGKVRARIETVDGQPALVITFPVRGQASEVTFLGASATVDGVTYTVQGSNDLSGFDVPVAQLPAPLSDGMPPLSDAAAWHYRSFRLSGDIPARGPKGFLRVKVD